MEDGILTIHQAEMSMRNWIMQPGSMITHVESVRFGIVSLLGILAMLAALVSLLYTSASAALVSPQLKFGDYESKTMQGLVRTSYANPTYNEAQCQTPVMTDTEYGGDTCLSIENAAQGYYSYFQTFLKSWSIVAASGNGTSSLATRPRGTALLYENVTVTGAWIERRDPVDAAAAHGGRIINNVTLAMPHPGVVTASKDPINNLGSPEGSQGLGAFSLRASVPSPAVYVLCVNATQAELQPLVYADWPDAPEMDPLSWPAQAPSETNSSVFDELFGWGPGQLRDPPLKAPIFAKRPIDYNTILNNSALYGDHDGIYLLGKTGPEIGSDVYALCSLR